MKHIILHIIFTLLIGQISQAQLLTNLGGQRAGVSSLTFLKNDVSPRSMALSGANLTLAADGMSTVHNTALLAQTKGIYFAISDLALGAGIHQSWLSGSVPLKSSTSALGLNLNYLSSGAMKVRTEFQPNGTGEYFYANQLAGGLAYSKLLSDRFSFGLNLKMVHERLAQYTNTTVAADLGFLYSTDVKDLKFGIVVHNFGGNSILSGDEVMVDFNRKPLSLDKYSLPTIFRLGASMKPWKTDMQSLMLAVQLEHPNDNSENIRIGVEYAFKNLFFVRAGYKLNVKGENLPTMGFGYKARFGRNTMMVNYGVNATQYLGTLHAFGLDFMINNDKRE
ncbi:MAG: PorV/PorQ family protein [Salibacteraceae bacterium]